MASEARMRHTLRGVLVPGAAARTGALQSAHRYRRGLGHNPELDGGPRCYVHGDCYGGVEAETEYAFRGAPQGGAEASLTPAVRSLPRLEHFSPTAYEGCGVIGGSSPGCPTS